LKNGEAIILAWKLLQCIVMVPGGIRGTNGPYPKMRLGFKAEAA